MDKLTLVEHHENDFRLHAESEFTDATVRITSEGLIVDFTGSGGEIQSSFARTWNELEDMSL